MDEEEFDSLMGSRAFGTADALRADARLRRCATLGAALWGRTSDDLQRQLLAPYPATFGLCFGRLPRAGAKRAGGCFRHEQPATKVAPTYGGFFLGYFRWR